MVSSSLCGSCGSFWQGRKIKERVTGVWEGSHDLFGNQNQQGFTLCLESDDEDNDDDENDDANPHRNGGCGD